MSAEDALARLEREVLAAAQIGDYLKRVTTLRKLLAEESETIRGIVLAMVAPRLEGQALAAVLDAFKAGALDALSILDDIGIEPVSRIGRPDASTRAALTGLDKKGREALAKAKKLAAAKADLSAILAPLIGHANTVNRTVTYAINAAGNQGTLAVADAADRSVVWVAEYNACVDCAAYSGRTARVGADFPGGLSYGPPTDFGSLPHPPLHPNCRCTIEPLRSREYAKALRREADRGVLRGFSLQSESMATRIAAAERLLGRTGANAVKAPVSVIDYARAAVKRGEFRTRGR